MEKNIHVFGCTDIFLKQKVHVNGKTPLIEQHLNLIRRPVFQTGHSFYIKFKDKFLFFTQITQIIQGQLKQKFSQGHSGHFETTKMTENNQCK